MKIAGFCLGASSVSLVEISRRPEGIEIIKMESRSHDGNARQVLEELVAEQGYGPGDKVAATGRKFRQLVLLSSIPEPEAVELACGYLRPKYGIPETVVSAGGETFMVYEMDANGRVCNLHTGNKCASGSGEFFLQQVRRMGLNAAEAVALADGEQPYKVAGRCSVFCKSDCTHALNKGVPKGRVVAGLCQMMAIKIAELLRKCRGEKVLLIGGAARNRAMIAALRAEVPGLLVADEAACFEALGAALWALDHETVPMPAAGQLFQAGQVTFSSLPPLSEHVAKVSFKTMERGVAAAGDECLVGLDVGSTTTKAILLRLADNAMLASVYLRTSGDPVGASRQCYAALAKQLSVPVRIAGLGVTGSGRQIAGLHAGTAGVVNEIIAHAAAAVHFDPEVNTIFEIGGQDAKYTSITNRVASDYAMNEACSAGTGSFLEEAAKESMGIEVGEIAGMAWQSRRPPNFNDQCAAFISSDIKNAIQEGLSREDIVAGLVYSVCQNYANRVKGNRPIGKKVFMQGGVCYNRAVPTAMAALTGMEIIVPPEPGLMGAFGVALDVRDKLRLGLLAEQEFDLAELAAREVAYGKPFVCNGGRDQCDRHCQISVIKVNGEQHPFGGACNKYYNLRNRVEHDAASLDLVALRHRLVFGKYAPPPAGLPAGARRIGIPKTFLVNSLYPLYHTFFSRLGFEVVLGSEVDPEGQERKGAAFCHPVELAHGMVAGLLKQKIDILFLPQIIQMHVHNGGDNTVVCPFVQGEPYYLRSAFPELASLQVLNPVLDFSGGYDKMADEFAKIGSQLELSRSSVREAYAEAVAALEACQKELQAAGRRVLDDLAADPERSAIVVFGRPYNAFANEANMGIPHKFASRGQTIIPCDCLPLADEDPAPRMYWGSGQLILKAAKLVARHPQLFGVYITNFSCGPDSFLNGYFRDAMGVKPSLTLELDSHTADAGVDTRVEAFLDVVRSYRERLAHMLPAGPKKEFRAAVIEVADGVTRVIDSLGVPHHLNDPRVHLLIPSMGDTASRLLAATFRYAGVRASCLPPPGEKELKLGKAHASCKECLPLMLTLGGGARYLLERQDEDELLVYFMPETSGPCRFGQYNVLMQNLIQKHSIPNVALLSLTSDNGYAGLGTEFQLRAWRSVIISDMLDDIYSALLVLARDQESALQTYRQAVDTIVEAIASLPAAKLRKVLVAEASRLAAIPRKGGIEDLKTIALVGEIYVRRDGFSRRSLVEKLAAHGIAVRVAPVAEWLYYCDYCIKEGAGLPRRPGLSRRIKSTVAGFFKRQEEREIKTILAGSGLCHADLVDVPKMIENVRHLISPHLTGEAILTIGAALTEIIDEVSGVIAIGPFGCMPNRMAEAIISECLSREKPKISEHREIIDKVLAEHPALPFLAIESDGNAFPQVIEARLEAFCLQVERVHQTIRKVNASA